MFLMELLLMLILILLNIAFITLFERKILSFSQNRLGPNKVSFMGIMQPISDAIKLFTKQEIYPMSSFKFMFCLSPLMMMFLSMMIWTLLQSKFLMIFYKNSIIFMLMLLSLGIYPLLFTGWYSNNNYSYIGAIRGVAQTISYEICMAFYFMLFILYMMSINIMVSTKYSEMNMFMYFPGLLPIWLLILLAETNRTPFDFSEGESELVSGFNIEYASVNFALLFMAEYGMIYMMSFLSISLFFANISMWTFFFLMLTTIFFWMWTRASLPRHRFDLLMSLVWKSLLPIVLGLVILLSVYIY